MLIAALQLPSIGLSSTKLYHYIRMASNKNIKLLILGEYLLNSFFKELTEMSIEMIKEQSIYQIKILQELSTKYGLIIIAPLVIVKKNRPYKCIIKFAPNSVSYYNQQILINYQHWNEKKFFANSITKLQSPLIFNINRLKFAVIGGFEIHIDKLWALALKKNVDAVIIPSASTFESSSRWKSIAITRALTYNCYVLRANRIGTYKEDGYEWNFYGDSFLVNPNGEIINSLDNSEGLMIDDIKHIEVLKARRSWGFKDINTKYC